MPPGVCKHRQINIEAIYSITLNDTEILSP